MNKKSFNIIKIILSFLLIMSITLTIIGFVVKYKNLIDITENPNLGEQELPSDVISDENNLPKQNENEISIEEAKNKYNYLIEKNEIINVFEFNDYLLTIEKDNDRSKVHIITVYSNDGKEIYKENNAITWYKHEEIEHTFNEVFTSGLLYHYAVVYPCDDASYIYYGYINLNYKIPKVDMIKTLKANYDIKCENKITE